MKKTLSVLLSLLMLMSVTAGLDFSAYADVSGYVAYEYDYVNPLYGGTQASYADSAARARSFSLADSVQSDTFYTVDDSAEFLRKNMINRQLEIIVNLETRESDYEKLVKSIFNGAVDENISKCSSDGDYLKFSYGGYSVSIRIAQYSTGDYKYTLTYTVSYYTTAQQEAAIQNEIEKIIQDYDLNHKSDYAKVKTIHDIVCDRIKYDYDNLNNTDYKPQFTAYAALFDGKAVCQGYALLFHRLAKEVGLDTRIIAGVNHAWNIVKVDGQYYEVDCTWDDSSYDNINAPDGDYWSSGRVIYDYFMKGSSDFYGHTRLDEYDTAEFHAQYPMAQSGYVCSHKELVWVYDEGASCTEGFVKTEICANCEKVFDTSVIPAGSHVFDSGVVRVPATCVQTGIRDYTCTVCGYSYSESIPRTQHNYVTEVVAPTENERGYTKHTCSICKDTYTDNITDYASDNSALIAALDKVFDYKEEDYSPESYENLLAVYDAYKHLVSESLPQTQIDSTVYEILTAISDLVPYLNLNVEGANGTVSVSYNGTNRNTGKYSILFGTEITLTAAPKEGYIFDGWYEKVTKRIFSYDEVFTFKMTSNTDFEARFIKENAVSLIFSNESGQKQAIIDKTPDEWKELTTISALLPEVPYKLGYTNGRWVYDDAEVLSKLRNGEDVTVFPEYDGGDYEYPTVPVPEDENPVLDLYYRLDENNSVGSFIMAMGLPEDCRVESIGIAFYYKKAAQFDPDGFELTMNNKMMTGKFNSVSPNGIYIVNIRNLSSKYNWAARGYVTYYDEDDHLKIAYSNQINIVDRAQVQ